MKKDLKFWQVDSFATKPFKGNPAAVFIIDEELDDDLMQNIATEMNLSETAFVLMRQGKNPYLRWFTPLFEIDLCGHATLASAHIYITEIFPDLSEVTFDTKFVGPLNVQKINSEYRMNFPSRLGEKQQITEVPQYVLEALSTARPFEAYKSRDLMLVYEDDQVIHDIAPDFKALLQYKDFIIVTAKSSNSQYDFISRFFCADDGITEDPVTGSAHCTLAPYWSKTLGKKNLKAYQASARGGELGLEVTPERVMITGKALTVIKGKMTL